MSKSKKAPVDLKNRSKNDKLPSSVQQLLKDLDTDHDQLEIENAGDKILLSHLNKVFWPKHARQREITKRNYIAYLVTISQYILPHLKDRTLTLIRFPNGIKGGRFYQKHWEDNLPPFVETVRAYTEHEGKDQDFLLCNNLSTLIWLGQIANLELHTSHTRVSVAPDAPSVPLTFTGSLENIESSLLNYPDYLVFDLDPYLYSGREHKGEEPELNKKAFDKTCDLALWLKELFDNLSLRAFVKTSGKTGLHIYIPIVRNIDYDAVRRFSEEIGRCVQKSHPSDVTMEWAVAKRTGKVFLDHNMNARSKSLASIYSPRVADGAPVSTPVRWEELRSIYPTDFKIDCVPKRLEQIDDLWSNILTEKNDLRHLFSGTGKERLDFSSKAKTRGRAKRA